MSQTIGNPQVVLGTLNRLRGSIQIPAYPNLNVTAPYLGEEGISLSWEGNATTFLPQMVGSVLSLEPYQMMMVQFHLLKTQSLASQWEAQRLLNSALGDITVKLDAATMPQYLGSNAGIEGVETLTANGKDAGYVVSVRATYYINNSAWSLT